MSALTETVLHRRKPRSTSSSRSGGARAAVLVLAVALVTAAAATVVSASAALPSCRVTDVMTAQRSYDAWARTVLDTTFALPASYAPRDLRSTSSAGLNSGHSVRRFVVADLAAMASAARRAGARLAVQSAYRSYATQISTFRYWVSVSGYSTALRSSARAGHSEHQLGTTVDFRSYGGSRPGTTATGARPRPARGCGSTPGSTASSCRIRRARRP